MNTLTFTVTLDQANIIMAGLSELPVKASLTLINELQKQAQEQMKPQAETVEVQS